MPAPNEITPQKLFRLIGTPDAPRIFDLRIDEDFAEDPRLVPGATRAKFTDLDRLISDQPTVVYCQKGRKIAHGTAAMLATRGMRVEVLEGGQFGWRDSGLPMLHHPDGAAPPRRWVTRHRPKIDRIACPWLIRRFIDPQAEFLFVPGQDVEMVAEKFDAEPFDVDGVRFSHHGTGCSFDAVLSAFSLEIPALNTMADIIRAADTGQPDAHPHAPGLMAISLGLSRMYRDDLAQLDAGMMIYDALYRWARDAQGETHDGPGHGGAGS